VAFVVTCASPGCLCRDRVPRYPSDLTDEQWAVLEPRAREVMRELVIAEGRPMVHDLRAMCDAIAYVARNGIEWRALPVDFRRGEAVYAFYQRWNARGLPQALAARLRRTCGSTRPSPSRRRASGFPDRHVLIPCPLPAAGTTVEEDHRPGQACRRRRRGLAAGAGGHRRVRQRRPGQALVIRLFNAIGTLRSCGLTAATTGNQSPPRQDCRGDHAGSGQAHQPAQ
jgi:transposase